MTNNAINGEVEKLRDEFESYCKESGVDLEKHVLLPGHLAMLAVQRIKPILAAAKAETLENIYKLWNEANDMGSSDAILGYFDSGLERLLRPRYAPGGEEKE